MPIKRRKSKARMFDDYHREQLIKGPDSALLVGTGYHAGWYKHWREMDEDERGQIISEMEADWRIHGPELMRWWNAGDGKPMPSTKPWIFLTSHDADELPWAARKFGVPEDRS